MPVEYLHLLVEGKHHQRKVQRSGPASGQAGAGCSNSSCNYNHHTTDQIRTSTGTVGVPDAAINATCVRACRGNMVSPHTSCIDCCIRHSNNLHWWCFSFQQLAKILQLHMWWSSPVATCAGGVFPSNHWRKYSTCTVWWWLHVVVVYICGSGGIYNMEVALV